jgi:hypothetical protein
MVAYQAVVLQSRVRIRHLPSPQLTANLLVGCHLEMALGCGLTSVRGNRGKNYKMNCWFPKNIQRKKKKIIMYILNRHQGDKLSFLFWPPFLLVSVTGLCSFSHKNKPCLFFIGKSTCQSTLLLYTFLLLIISVTARWNL